MNECIIFNLFNDGVIDLAHNHLQSLKNNNITNYISFTTGVFPHELKIANVVPIYKGGNDNIFSNYRPVSDLPVFSKLLER